MFARIARYEIPADQLGQAVEAFREAGGELNGLDGFEHGYLLVDEEAGGLATLTFWGNRAHMEASRSSATRLRQNALSGTNGNVHSVVEYDVAARFGG